MRRPRFPDNGGEIARTAILACVVAALLASSVAMVSAARTLDLGPAVGDILVFRRGTTLAGDWEFTATKAGAVVATCSLRPVVMAASGGSLVIEQRFQSPRSYSVHWAGGPTSDGVSSCGDNAELIVPGADLQLLANAVGGAGVEHRTFGLF